MAQRIDRSEFNRDLTKYVGKASKSNTRFINLSEFINKKNTSNDETELIELKEKKGFNLYFSKFLNLFKSEEKEEKEEIEDVTDEITETEEELMEEDDNEFVEEHKENKISFFERIFGSKENEHDETLHKMNKELLHDLKSVSVFAKDLLEFIPEEELDNLKQDGSLDEFKNILRKNNLLKKN